MNSSVPPYRAGGTAINGGPISPMCIGREPLQGRDRAQLLSSSSRWSARPRGSDHHPLEELLVSPGHVVAITACSDLRVPYAVCLQDRPTLLRVFPKP